MVDLKWRRHHRRLHIHTASTWITRMRSWTCLARLHAGQRKGVGCVLHCLPAAGRIDLRQWIRTHRGRLREQGARLLCLHTSRGWRRIMGDLRCRGTRIDLFAQRQTQDLYRSLSKAVLGAKVLDTVALGTTILPKRF